VAVTRSDDGDRVPAVSGSQGTLFDDDEVPGLSGRTSGHAVSPGSEPAPAGIGYRGPTACSAAGITYNLTKKKYKK